MPTGNPSLIDFSEIAPQIDTPLLRAWIARGANFVTCHLSVHKGASFLRSESQSDEYMVFVTEGAATIETATETCSVARGTLTIVPPGRSEIRIDEAGSLVLLFSSQASDLGALAANAASYAEPVKNVAPLVSWPMPRGGYKLRSYRVDEHTREGSNMRIFRSRNLMLNIMLPRQAPRDTSMLSPHAHEDFEQGSVALKGTWTHHLRFPWTKDLSEWRDDEHLKTGSPSLLVIPPQVIHTSHNVSQGDAWLLDIFAPPRLDFSKRPGMICNADDYPMPDTEETGI